MYATSSSSVSGSINGMGPDIDGSGTINPAALNASLPLPAGSLNASTGASTSADNTTFDNPDDYTTSPRGIKRSRSDDQYVEHGGEVGVEEGNDHAPRKRGRPPKTPKQSGSTTVPSPASAPSSQRSSKPAQPQARTPQLASQPLPQTSSASPVQNSPPAKATPKSVVKALPTVRDHTTDQLDKEGDEYIPKERDPSGEAKVDDNGHLTSGRTYKCRTFRVHARGSKLFMLATECARVLGYRDSYLLFNKNKSLYKIIASQAEKDDLIGQDILPYSYRSRQIAIVTARSMFRQFGSRVIGNGRRVRDDYWESKARKQGFTEEDLAGEKRPGAAKARENAAAEPVNVGTLPALGHNEVVYSNEPQIEGHGFPHAYNQLPSSLAPLPMINPAPSDDPRMREYGNFTRPRQEMSGQAYQDRTQPSTASEILNQASHTAEFNKILNQQRGYRTKGLDEHWQKPHEVAPSDTQEIQSSSGQVDSAGPSVPHTLHQRQDLGSSAGLPSDAQQNMVQSQHAMAPQSTYPQALHSQQPVSQSPLRSVGQPMRPEQQQIHHRSPSMALPSGAGGGRGYAYPQPQQLWGHPTPQPQPSPLGNSQHMNMPQFAHQIHSQQQSPSPHPHQTPSHHPSQSPRHQSRPVPSPQLHGQPQPHHQQTMAPVGYPVGTAAPYPALSAASGMYPPSPGPGGSQQFLPGAPQQPVSLSMGMGNNAALPGWPTTAGSTQGGWPATY